MIFEVKLILVSCLCRMKYFSEHRKLILSGVFVRSLHQLKSGTNLCKSAMRQERKEYEYTTH